MNKKNARARDFDPAPDSGLSRSDFHRICDNGFGDGHNSFAHSLAWFNDHIYIGTTRSNFQMAKIQNTFRDLPLPLWPVEGPDDAEGLYRELDRRAQIWRYSPKERSWEQVFRSPLVNSIQDETEEVARETGYRAMLVFQGHTDPDPVLYAATWAVSRSPGALLLRSTDGKEFTPVSPYGVIEGLPVTATRILIPFKGNLYTSPTGTRGFTKKFVINVSGNPVIYENPDPGDGQGNWTPVCEPGFGEPENLGVFMLCPFKDYLYAGTFNNEGFQIWKSKCEGKPPYSWKKIIGKGAYRGPLNQIAATMKVFKGALYIGTAIQNGGNDLNNKIGPAGAELIRINEDDSWDLIIGSTRDTPDGKKTPLSSLMAGFGNTFNGYFWSIEEHEGWLYLGTMDSTIWFRYLSTDAYPENVRDVIERVGPENIVANDAGCDLWRSADGENWLPITGVGFDNCYNLGIRNMVSTPHGLFLALANPFGPRVAVNRDGEWAYEDNPRGGLEVWLGTKENISTEPGKE
jgi:hypothetical protein